MEATAIETPTQDVPATQLERKNKLTGKVSKITLAGALVDLGVEMPGFIHLTQLQPGPVNRVEEAVEIGQMVDVWVRRVAKKKGYIELTMVEPLGLEWREIDKGMVVSGKVTRIESFGVFLEIGAERPGLIHVSELSHDYIKNPHEVVSVGDEIEARVIEVNRRKKQIKLSRKATLEKAVPQEEARIEEIEENVEDNTPVPTAMEVALRQAMKKQGKARKARKGRRTQNDEREDILSRTLANQARTHN